MAISLADFVQRTTWEDLPESVRRQARRCLLDTLAAAIGGRQTEVSRISHDFAAAVYGAAAAGQSAQLWLDGRPLTAPGAALANGMTIDGLDIHDGFAPAKGHAGAAIVPAALATLVLGGDAIVSGRELLTTIVVGYEVALRAAVALHATACDYHTSGAWNALGCAALTGRRLRLAEPQLQHALGIAEYHGPRSPMMRCIDHPTMVKDGSGWGAMTGVSAAMLAQAGFTGAPAETATAAAVARWWDDLGQRWLIDEQYFKPYAVCRWAQPAIVALLALRESHQFAPESVRRLRVFTFHEAVRLHCRRPESTEEAQYSLPFPLAAALFRRQLGPAELSGQALRQPAVLALAERVELIEEAAYSARFPARRFARVQVEMDSGDLFESAEVEATWGEDAPPSDDELRQKFRWLARHSLPAARAAALEKLIWHCHELPDAAALAAALAAPLAWAEPAEPALASPA